MGADLFDLTGRLALVTGSSRGIGLALARGLAAAGARVIVNARQESSLIEVVEGLSAEGYEVHACAFDVTDPQAVAAGVARCEAEFGPIDILVNNAGIQRRSMLTEVDEEIWRSVMSTNLDAVFRVGREVAVRMIPRGAQQQHGSSPSLSIPLSPWAPNLPSCLLPPGFKPLML